MEESNKLPIVLVHGMWGGPHHWNNWISVFKDSGHTVTAVTLPHHGHNGNPSELSLTSYVNAVRKTVKNTGDCILIGHSMGGLISQKIAGEDSAVRRLVVVTSAAPKGILALTPRILWTMRRCRYIKAMCTGEAFKLYPKDARSLMMNGLDGTYDPDDIFTAKESGEVAYELAFSPIQTQAIFECPVLVIAGTRDRMTPVRIQKAIAEKNHGELRTYDCGHLPMIEPCHDEIVDDIVTWLELIDLRDRVGFRTPA